VIDLPPHQKFERLVERIHQLLEVEGSTVTWDDTSQILTIHRSLDRLTCRYVAMG
jgi:hypothetical protein